MQTVLIVVHLMIVLALIGVVLLQRSEGGGLGIGGGSGFMTARGAANALTRATAILATMFFVTSLLLSIMARYGEKPADILDRVPTTQSGDTNGGVLDQLGGKANGTTPAAPAPANNAAAPAAPAADAATTPAEAAPAAPAADGAAAPAAPAPSAPAQGGTQVPNSQ